LTFSLSKVYMYQSHPKISKGEVMQPARIQNGFRKSSQWIIFGLPLWDIALGPNMQRGESRGCARGIIAIGDIAKGWIALGGIAYGGIAIGGLSFGIIAVGGASIGLIALGGLAIGGIAFGGGAIGIVAMGGAALGYYAVGGGAFGKYIISGMEKNPEAIEFFRQWFPNLPIK
jgi:hypothetical protein